MLFQMLNLLLTIKHLPALNAKHFSIRLLFDRIKSIDEGGPFGRVTLDHTFSVSRLRKGTGLREK